MDANWLSSRPSNEQRLADRKIAAGYQGEVSLDPFYHSVLLERDAEIAVLVSLFAVGQPEPLDPACAAQQTGGRFQRRLSPHP